MLEAGEANCSGKSILYASLMEALGYEACVISFPSDDHMIGGIKSLDGTANPSIASGSGYINVDMYGIYEGDSIYWPAETTGEAWDLGEIITGLHSDWTVVLPES